MGTRLGFLVHVSGLSCTILLACSYKIRMGLLLTVQSRLVLPNRLIFAQNSHQVCMYRAVLRFKHGIRAAA